MDIQLEFNVLEVTLDDVIEQLAGVSGVEQIHVYKPLTPTEGTKDGGAISGLQLKLVSSALEGALRAVDSVVRRLTATPTEITIIHEGKTLKLKYDPRYEGSDEIALLMHRLLSTAVGPAPHSV